MIKLRKKLFVILILTFSITICYVYNNYDGRLAGLYIAALMAIIFFSLKYEETGTIDMEERKDGEEKDFEE